MLSAPTKLLPLLTLALMATGCKKAAPTPGARDATVGSPDGAAPDGVAKNSNGAGSDTDDHEEPDPPATPRTAYQLAMIDGDAALRGGRFEDARAAYERAIEQRAGATAPVLGLLRTLVLPGNGKLRHELEARVRTQIDRYRAKEETIGASHLLAARLAIALGQVGEAMDKSRLAVQRLPDMGVAWRVLGEAAMAAELWGDAVSALRRAAELGLQAAPGTWERLADSLDELGELSAAEEAARKAVELSGRDRHAQRRRLTLLAVVLKHRGDLEGAGEVLDKALKMGGASDPIVLHDLGSLAEARGKMDEALAAYDKALALAPVPMTSWRRGHLLLKLDRPAEALGAFTAATANLPRWQWPRSTRWWPAYEVAKLWAAARRYDKAAGWFEDAMREARTADATREVRSWLYFCRTQATKPPQPLAPKELEDEAPEPPP